MGTISEAGSTVPWARWALMEDEAGDRLRRRSPTDRWHVGRNWEEVVRRLQRVPFPEAGAPACLG